MKNLKILLTNITFAQFWNIGKFFILPINLFQIIFIGFISIYEFLSIIPFFFIFVLLTVFLSCSFFCPFSINNFLKTWDLLLWCRKFLLEIFNILLKCGNFLIFLLVEPSFKLLPFTITIRDLLFKLYESILCLFHRLIFIILTFLWLCYILLLYLTKFCFISSYLGL